MTFGLKIQKCQTHVSVFRGQFDINSNHFVIVNHIIIAIGDHEIFKLHKMFYKIKGDST